MARYSQEYYDGQVGKTYNRLTITEVLGGRHCVVECQCSCGTIKKLFLSSLISGNTKSCGCLRKEWAKEFLAPLSKVHGLSHTKEHRIWMGVVGRCTRPTDNDYPNYGGRGILLDDSWKGPDGFIKFLEDMGPCPDGLTIEREDVNGNYCKENCIWDTMSEQNFNRRILCSNTSGRTGVHFNKRAGKFHVSIRHQGKTHNVGYFVEFDDAVKAREDIELELFGFIKEN